MLDRLVEKEILTRKYSMEDRRKVAVRVSPEDMVDIKGFEETILHSLVEPIEKLGRKPPENGVKF